MIATESQTCEQALLEADTPVLAYFWATWCQACKRMTPQMEALATENDPRYKIVGVDIGANPEVAEKYGVMSTPTLLLFKPGNTKPTEIQVGFAAKDWVKGLVETYLNK